jgi:hypothetical protein
MFGLSLAAQRGCWKLFHETATVQSPEAAWDPPTDAAADAAVDSSAADGAAEDPLPVQAANTRARVPSAAAVLRIVISCSSMNPPT